jgi:hypothetical protein
LTSPRKQTVGWEKKPEKRTQKKGGSSVGGGIQRNALARQGSTYEGFGEEGARKPGGKIQRNAKRGSTYDGFGEDGGEGVSDETLV